MRFIAETKVTATEVARGRLALVRRRRTPRVRSNRVTAEASPTVNAGLSRPRPYPPLARTDLSTKVASARSRRSVEVQVVLDSATTATPRGLGGVINAFRME